MSLKRILKMLFAALTGQGVQIVSQLIVPPLFLLRYTSGLAVYGDWITMSAAVQYLTTLNYGIQNYAANEITILYNRGELKQARAIQASALRLILIVAALLAGLAAMILFIPIGSWMGIRNVSAADASLTMFLLVLQLLVFFIFSFFSKCFMVIGEAHRGELWGNAHALGLVLGLAGVIWLRGSFPMLAASQLAGRVLFTLLIFFDLRFKAPFLLPSLRNGSWPQMVEIIKPSAYFGLLSISSFLIWQGPVLILEKVLGPVSVSIFSLSRTVFSMSRQVLAVATFSISQEITHLVGQRDWPRLRRLYDLSEKVVLFLIPSSTLGTLLLSPFLFSIWLHHRSIYQPLMCMLMAAVSAVIGIKEHKWQFQWSSNEHVNLSKFYLVAYLLMLILSFFLMPHFGVNAFMVIWLVTEIVVTIYIVILNGRLFPDGEAISTAPLWRLACVLVFGFALAAWPAWKNVNWSLLVVVASAVFMALLLAVVSYFTFGLEEVREVVAAKLRRRKENAAT